MEKNHVILSLARQDFRVVSTESPEYMKELETAVNARIDGIRSKYPTMSTLRIVLLAMLDMEDDLHKAGLDKAASDTSDEADVPEEDDF